MTATPPRRRRDRRPLAFGTAVTGIAAVVVAVIVLSSRPVVTPPPGPSVSLPPPTVTDQPRAAVDGTVIDGDLAHDSRDDLYRTPFGAVPVGTEVTLRLRAAAGDLSDATVRVWDGATASETLVPMQVAATDAIAGDHGFDYWEATLDTAGPPRVLWYRFIVTDGDTTRFVEDDPPIDEGDDGGSGRVYDESVDSSWQIDVHDPAFATPAWARGAVVYQVFPDRFLDGDTANDPSPDALPGTDGADVYRHGDVYGNPILPKAWTDAPEGACRAYVGAGICTDQPSGRDFFGGDLKGITDKLDDLRDLGVTVLYLNPVFAAPSNHRYDTSDYGVIDPDLGTREDFDRLVAQAGEKGMRVILDGVFNHVSSDSPWFDRFGRYPEVGACESADSPYRTWFTFQAPPAGEVGPCAPSIPGGTDTAYVSWAGFDTIPELTEVADVDAALTGPDGVVGRWITAGASGWRLDVMDGLSHDLVGAIRTATKAADPDALILGEQWGDTSEWLLGDEADSTMNYRFRRAVIGLFNGPTADPDGAIAGLTPSAFASRMESVREDYPAAAWDVLLNLVDSHDTTRILWTLTPGVEDPSEKEAPENLAVGKTKLRSLAALQLTWPGMASIYYGTEVGITGQDDPDDRRPYPWDARDDDLRDWYRTLGRLRTEHEALRDGDLRFVNADDDAGTLAFARRTTTEAAVTVLNLSAEARDVVLALGGIVPVGTVMTDDLGDVSDATVGTDGTATVTIPAGGSAVFFTNDSVDLSPPGTPTGLTATASPGQVELVWAAPTTGDPTMYRIWRSLVTGGGYVPVGDTMDRYYVDPTVRNGTRYQYVITALDEAGNVGARSIEAVAAPALTVADARLAGPAAVSQTVGGSGAGAGVPIAALVRVDNVTNLSGPTVGVAAQLGYGPAPVAGASDPGLGYAWSDMTFDADVAADGADRLVTSLSPPEPGTYGVLLRISTDGRRTWRYADLVGLADPSAARAIQPVTLTVTPGGGGSPVP